MTCSVQNGRHVSPIGGGIAIRQHIPPLAVLPATLTSMVLHPVRISLAHCGHGDPPCGWIVLQSDYSPIVDP
jgi:hypothetical protein